MMAAAGETKAGQKGELRDTIERLDQSSKSLRERPGAHRQHRGPHRPRRGDHRQADEGRAARQRGAGRRRGRQRLRAEHHAPADHRGPAQRLQLPREHHQELRRSCACSRREDKYYLIELINDPRGLTSITDTDGRHDQPEQAVALPHDHDDDDRQLPLLAAVRQAHRARSPGASASRSRPAASASTSTSRRTGSRSSTTSSASARRSSRATACTSRTSSSRTSGSTAASTTSSTQRSATTSSGLQLRFNDEDLKTILPVLGRRGRGGQVRASRTQSRRSAALRSRGTSSDAEHVVRRGRPAVRRGGEHVAELLGVVDRLEDAPGQRRPGRRGELHGAADVGSDRRVQPGARPRAAGRPGIGGLDAGEQQGQEVEVQRELDVRRASGRRRS